MMSPFVESYNRLWPPHPELDHSARDAVWIVAVDGGTEPAESPCIS